MKDQALDKLLTDLKRPSLHKTFYVPTTAYNLDMSKPLPGEIKIIPEHQRRLVHNEARKLEKEKQAAQRKLEKQCIAKASQAKIRFLRVSIYTVCYRVDRRSVIELSTAICHPNDKFDPHKGRVQALENFTNKQRILIKNTTDMPHYIFLEMLFGTIS